MAFDLGNSLIKQTLGSGKIVTGTKANIDTGAVAVGSDTDQLREVIFQCDPDNTSGVFIGSTTAQHYQLNKDTTITLPVSQVSHVEVRAQGADTDITVHYIGFVY